MKLPGFNAEVSVTKFSEQYFSKMNYPNRLAEIVPSTTCRFYPYSSCPCWGIIGCEGPTMSFVLGEGRVEGCSCA
jgi:hypothetical protein